MIAAPFARLSSGIKMLIILSTALLPLGLIALSASLESASHNHITRQTEAQILAVDGGRRLDDVFARVTASLHVILGQPPGSGRAACAAGLARLAPVQAAPPRLALFDSMGRRICASGALSPTAAAPPAPGIGTAAQLIPARNVLRLTMARDGRIAVGEIDAGALKGIAGPALAASGAGMMLRQGDAVLPISAPRATGPLARVMTVATPVAQGQMRLDLIINAAPIRAIELLMITLPILMWLAAALTGWLVADRLLLRPLAQMQRAISAYHIGDGPLHLPAMTTPAQEIRHLGESFRAVTERVTAHERELEQGLARQTKLTREVHHRVKNNLQVVSSLISLHARGAKSADVAAAYASIQRRVDALAVVHRNHYAELEENRGVSLRALIGELATNLRATAPAEAAHLVLTLQIADAFVSQDVAVPVSFLITELVELVMTCDPQGGVAITLSRAEAPDRAALVLRAPGLSGHACTALPSFERASRILGGLARQLRAPLLHDAEAGRYAIDIAIAPDRDDGPPA